EGGGVSRSCEGWVGELACGATADFTVFARLQRARAGARLSRRGRVHARGGGSAAVWWLTKSFCLEAPGPSLKTLCKLAVIQYSLDQSVLPHDIRWELTAMTTNSNISRPIFSSHG
uniref:Kelch domain-containing protein 3-like n=1 Tax=Callorhinchus milii TaxID=7868 RepID=A0A4W3H088_CALMI